ncbi:MAG: hydrogenase maturation protease [Acidobacteriia bacterium]|nr:hydrogenase maturation protease [Terriglobia bacterium]
MLILACGNRNRADDAAGILVAERLRELGIDAKECAGEAPDLMEAWSAADNVIVVDCVMTGVPAGTVHLWDASHPLAFKSSGSTHGLGLGEAIELARSLGCLPARLRIYGIEGKNFEVGAAVSVEVQRGVAEVVNKIAAETGSGQ